MAENFKKIAALKTIDGFRARLQELNLDLPCDAGIEASDSAPLFQEVPGFELNGKRLSNRFAIQPMEGWDGTEQGGATEFTTRRWRRFGESGASLIWGGEAMAVVPEGRANPNQLIISPETAPALSLLRETLLAGHRQSWPGAAEPIIGFQLTHSGRFCRPNDKRKLEPRIAFLHPILDQRFGVDPASALLRDEELPGLVDKYVAAARIAADCGADFVDIKHCHGYLLHEFLGAHTRPGPYGGSFENRTRLFREIVEGIRRSGNGIAIGVRLSAFDFVPFKPDPLLSSPGKPGPGVPEDISALGSYRYGFGVNEEAPILPDLVEARQFIRLCHSLGIRLINLTAGSPYYNPHIQRPAAYPPSDGYQPAHDPLIDVVRQIQAARELKSTAPEGLVFVGSAYSYLQDYLPHVAQAVVRAGWIDLAGLGRMVLSYPDLMQDLRAGRPMQPKLICRTFSDCTTAPRNGLRSGCYPLDKFYTETPEAALLKQIKRG